MKKKGGLKLLEGALLGAVLGVAAGVLLAPKSGKGLRRDVGRKAVGFYRYLMPQLKKVKRMSEKEYGVLVKKAMANYSKAKRLAPKEAKHLVGEAEKYWKHLRRHV